MILKTLLPSVFLRIIKPYRDVICRYCACFFANSVLKSSSLNFVEMARLASSSHLSTYDAFSACHAQYQRRLSFKRAQNVVRSSVECYNAGIRKYVIHVSSVILYRLRQSARQSARGSHPCVINFRFWSYTVPVIKANTKYYLSRLT